MAEKEPVTTPSLDKEDYKLHDGEVQSISCCKCGRELVGVLITRPQMPTVTRLTVECPFCDGASEPEEFVGAIQFQFVPSVVLVDTQDVNGMKDGRYMVATTVRTEKA